MKDWKEQLAARIPEAAFSKNQLVHKGVIARLVDFGEVDFLADDNAIYVHEDLWRMNESLVTSRLKSKFGLTSGRVFARKTNVQKIDLARAKAFIKSHHLLQWGGGQIAFALVLDEEIIGVAVFSKPRNMVYENPPFYSAVLIRFACQMGLSVVGGLDKLLQHYFKTYAVKEIITYIDNDWSDGSSFEKVGFEKISHTGPLYFEIDPLTLERKKAVSEHAEQTIKSSGSIKMKLSLNS